MQRGSVSYRNIQALLGACAVALFIFVSPGHAAAQTALAQTQQLLPIGGQNMCQSVTVSDVEPHIYGGTLQSFDLTINSTTYVGIFGSVGQTGVPLQYITRWATPTAGTMRFHVDTPTTPVGSGTTASLTMLSGPVGQPVCITVISFEVYQSGSTTGASPISITQTPYASGSGTSVSYPSGNGGGYVSVTNGGGQTGTKTTVTSTGHSTSTMTLASSSSSTLGVGQAYTGSLLASGFPTVGGLHNICAQGNAFRLWIVLLAIYLIIVAVVVFAEPWFLERSVLAATAAILVPLILLLIFWYVSAECRAAAWVPVVACVIAVVALFLAFREYEMPPPPVNVSS